jgi:hypothetical protein
MKLVTMTLKIYDDSWDEMFILDKKTKIYLKKHNSKNMQKLCFYVFLWSLVPKLKPYNRIIYI